MAETQMPANEPRAQIGTSAPATQQGEASKAGSAQQAQPAQQIGPEDVAERPELAPNIELSGEMQEGGFSETQWLIQRDGRFIQVTELLYRLAEHIDGQRNLEEIASGVSETYGKTVSAENVRQLIAKQLIPKGLVVKADGTVLGPPEGSGGARSPLAVNMRMAMISPRLIRPITAVLKYLYHPVILVAILVVAIGAQAWLFMVHGLAQSTRSAMYTPGLMLALMGTVILSAAFHEFGHASALEYGGGKVRGMGAGLYIIYPAFYTDVTDNYRLGRWSRIRTDLGGFYFNLIFSLGVIGVFLLTGQEWLLLSVALLDLDIIRQLLPIVRLDGYWALADLTGIPDFFSQIPAFLRTVLPLSWWKGPKLPDLKGWVKVVFALYILITIPLLAFLLFLMIKGVPRVLATAWDSFWKQSATFGQARSSGDIVLMIATGAQMLLLALPAFGTLFVIFNLVRRLGKAIWNWSKPTPLRRVIGGLGSAAAVALLVLLWMPRLPFTNPENNVQNPVYAIARPQFKPIEPQERGTLREAVRPVAFTGTDDLSSTAPVTATVEAATAEAATAVAAGELTPTVPVTTTGEATPTKSGLTPTVPVTTTNLATAVATLTPRATGTITGTALATPAVTSSPIITPTSASTPTPASEATTGATPLPAGTATPAQSAPTRAAATATRVAPSPTVRAPTATPQAAATATSQPLPTATTQAAATATPQAPTATVEAVATATTQAAETPAGPTATVPVVAEPATPDGRTAVPPTPTP